MTADQDPLKEHLKPGLKLFPEVDLEASIMTAVRKEAKLKRKARSLRRRGVMCLTGFIFLTALSLWYTQVGYYSPLYQSQMVKSGLVLFFTLVLFAQLEVLWSKRSPET